MLAMALEYLTKETLGGFEMTTEHIVFVDPSFVEKGLPEWMIEPKPKGMVNVSSFDVPKPPVKKQPASVTVEAFAPAWYIVDFLTPEVLAKHFPRENIGEWVDIVEAQYYRAYNEWVKINPPGYKFDNVSYKEQLIKLLDRIKRFKGKLNLIRKIESIPDNYKFK